MSLKLRNNWKYVGKDRWDWEAFIDGDDTDEISKIDYVEYILHPTFPNPVRITDDSNTGFKIQSNGWGIFDLKAFVHKKNGEVERLIHELILKYDPIEGKS